MGSLVLACDTATEQCAIALGETRDDRVRLLAVRDFAAPRAALSVLLPSVAELLDEDSRRVEEIGSVVVGRGPGSFTGVRIGVASAKGLAQGLGVPLHGVGTLDAIAWRFAETEGLLGVVGDAMRGEVYPAAFRLSDGTVTRLAADTVTRPEAAAEAFAAFDEPLVLAGNGLHKYRSVFEETLGSRGVCAPEAMWAPTGAGLLAAYVYARDRDLAGDGSPASLLPIYTRLSDAEENETGRASQDGTSVPPSGVADPRERTS